jgi:subtilisin family serine protease
VVNLSIGDGNNYQNDDFDGEDRIRERITALRKLNIPVVVAAGNDFFKHRSTQGMSYPAILNDCVSVGAVYDGDEGSFSYANGAMAYTSGPGRITPFSQRLHWKVGRGCRTDIFAPGAPITSSGIGGDKAISVQQGTSQASPVVAGVLLLMQELYASIYREIRNPPKNLPSRPTVQQLVTWMRRGGVVINDGLEEDDNVVNTGLDFTRIDAYGALHQVRKFFVRQFSIPE